MCFIAMTNTPLRHRPPGCEADVSLYAWIDGVSNAKNVPKHDFGDGCQRGILEIEFVAVTVGRSLGGWLWLNACLSRGGCASRIVFDRPTVIGRTPLFMAAEA